MNMRIHLSLAFILFSLLGCSQAEDPAAETAPVTDPAETDRAVMSWRDEQQQRGRELYQEACADCHDEGKDSAPTTGDAESWTDRSPLWSAVLLEHAKSGYLGMPARGGSELTDHDVELAGEYMLTETFPDLPRD